MSAIQTVRVDGKTYEYQQSVIESALRGKGLSETQIAQAVTDISNGDFTILKQHGLTHLVTCPSDAGLDVPNNYGALVFEKLAGKMDNIALVDIMCALHEAGEEIRKSAREMRYAERDIAMAEAITSAEKTRNAALASAICGFISSGINIVAGIGSTAAAFKAMGTAGATGAVSAIDMKFQSAQMIAKGVGSAADSIGQWISADFTKDAALAKANSDAASSKENESADFQKAAEELIASVRSIIKEALQAYNQTQASLYHNM